MMALTMTTMIAMIILVMMMVPMILTSQYSSDSYLRLNLGDP